MNENARLIRILRNMKWQECKGVLAGLLETCDVSEIPRDKNDELHAKICNFIEEMEADLLGL